MVKQAPERDKFVQLSLIQIKAEFNARSFGSAPTTGAAYVQNHH
jgi:hypothetical protein